MASRKVYVFEEIDAIHVEVQKQTNSVINVFENVNESVINYDDNHSIVHVYEQGPQGSKGERGPVGFSGAGEPFYVIRSGSLYASTASLAFFGYISSSILPWSSSFDLGNEEYRWKKVFVSESIEFDNYIIKSVGINHQLWQIRSGSVSSSINFESVFAVADFNYLPNPVVGGIIKSGSDFYFGY